MQKADLAKSKYAPRSRISHVTKPRSVASRASESCGIQVLGNTLLEIYTALCQTQNQPFVQHLDSASRKREHCFFTQFKPKSTLIFTFLVFYSDVIARQKNVSFFFRRPCVLIRLALILAYKKEALCNQMHNATRLWSCYPDSNWGPHPYQGCALPTEP